jgi:hypothetical protein
MPLVSFSGYFPVPGNVSSTKNAVHPSAGVGTLPTHVFGPLGWSGVFENAGPSTSNRKLRALGLVACQSCTLVGICLVTTLIDPSFSNVHLTSGRGAPAATAA